MEERMKKIILGALATLLLVAPCTAVLAESPKKKLSEEAFMLTKAWTSLWNANCKAGEELVGTYKLRVTSTKRKSNGDLVQKVKFDWTGDCVPINPEVSSLTN